MALEFEVELGTGSETSTSYTSEAEFIQYWENKGTDYSATASDTIKAWLNSATEYIDNNYKFEGEKTSSDQALSWPRCCVLDEDNNLVDSDVIPNDLKKATNYMAAQVKTTGLDLVDDNVEEESYGPVSKKYRSSSSEVVYKTASQYLSHYLTSSVTMIRVN